LAAISYQVTLLNAGGSLPRDLFGDGGTGTG
jgi:hypothetical protein